MTTHVVQLDGGGWILIYDHEADATYRSWVRAQALRHDDKMTLSKIEEIKEHRDRI